MRRAFFVCVLLISMLGVFTGYLSYAQVEGIRVVIDPGHGGKDSGAIAKDRTLEKDITLAISYKLQRILQQWNINALMTRYLDTYVSLNNRVEFVNQQMPDLCVSIHANSTHINTIRGFETYIYKPNIKHGDLLYHVWQVNLLRFSFPFTRAHDKSLQVAYFIHQQSAKYLDSKDRGIRVGNFQLLRKIEAPAVLVETGFLSNPTECLKLQDNAYQESIAQGIAEGIICALHGNLDIIYTWDKNKQQLPE